ncbi:MAG: 2-hydroxyglutaryl-CoA dehydratase, partial [Desulfovibrio sp.]|nr:2-hydroxyglutaryl-CoA dehydratase [Desulfovibrio sp.]
MSCMLGLDIGSTTVKAVVLDAERTVLFRKYLRHYSEVRACVRRLFEAAVSELGDLEVCPVITGSGGIDLAHELELPFLQEVLASQLAMQERYPTADVVIELGGEDAKLTFLTGGLEQRMNETCAGGTGAFIDQMGAFLGTDAAGLDELASKSKTIYPIASRCGVFAKMDILPLLNEGCAKEDLAASVLQAVVNQTISGLAHGRKIAGQVVFLGGPLTFLSYLRKRFCATLTELKEAIFPPDGQYFVAFGAAFYAFKQQECAKNLGYYLELLKGEVAGSGRNRLPALFAKPAERRAFLERHRQSSLTTHLLEDAHGRAWLGFDSGSTTMKAVLLNDNGDLLYSYYSSNRGDPLQIALTILKEIYARKAPDLEIVGAGATGYGSALLTAALRLDVDEVETVAHYTAAAFFEPRVSFVLDIGGQDIKCL